MANHQFTIAERTELLEERQEILDSIRLMLGGNTYTKLEYAESLGEDVTLLKLSDNNNNHVDLLLQAADSSEPCIVYQQPATVNAFSCGQAQRSISNDATLISSTALPKNLSVQLEYYSEAEEHFGSIGSTILTPSQTANQVNITTSFAFDDFFNQVLGMNRSDERINSTLGVTTYTQLNQIVQGYSGTEMTVKFNNHIGGSADDDINMYTGLLINSEAMTTIVTPTGSVFSGGTDLFAAGKSRILQRSANQPIEQNKQIGVHSWGQGDKTAKDFPYTDESHRKQATYFNKVMGDKGIDFYLFTLDSAPADGEHWVTKTESDQYGFITQMD